MQLNEIHDNHEHASTSLKTILLVFAIVLVGTLGYLVWDFNRTADTTDYTTPVAKKKTETTTTTTTTDETADWETYSNSKYMYSIKYSDDWAVREYPSNQNGAAFRPSSSSKDTKSELISVSYLGKATNDQSMTFEEYVKVAAIKEIQNFEKLLTNEKVTTKTGVVGYKTTWQYVTLSGETKTSGPIIYFPLKSGATTGTIQLSANVQSEPLTDTQLDIFGLMATTFSYK